MQRFDRRGLGQSGSLNMYPILARTNHKVLDSDHSVGDEYNSVQTNWGSQFRDLLRTRQGEGPPLVSTRADVNIPNFAFRNALA